MSVSEGRGVIDSRVSVLRVAAGVARSLLPAGLELMPAPTPDGQHPVFVLCSHNRFVAWFGTMDYEEIVLGVPYVAIADAGARHRGPYIYMPRLYLNARLPRELGVHIYGYEKEMAAITFSQPEAGVTRCVVVPDGESVPALSASFRAEAGRPERFANFAAVRRLFEQPTISQALHVVAPDSARSMVGGPFLASTIRFDFDGPDAEIEPLSAELVIGPTLTPAGLPEGLHEVASLAAAPLGAFRMRCGQVVSLPVPCDDPVRFATAVRGAAGLRERAARSMTALYVMALGTATSRAEAVVGPRSIFAGAASPQG